MAQYEDLFGDKNKIPDQKFRCWFHGLGPKIAEVEVVEAPSIERAAEQFVEESGPWDEGRFPVFVNPCRTSQIYKVTVLAHLELHTEAEKVTLTRKKMPGREKPTRTPRRKK